MAFKLINRINLLGHDHSGPLLGHISVEIIFSTSKVLLKGKRP